MKIVAQDRDTKEIHSVAVEEDCDFELPITLSGGEDNYMMSILQESPLAYVGPVVSPVSDTQAKSGLEISDSVSGITLEVDTTNRKAELSTTDDDLTISTGDVVRMTAGKPVGADNAGRGVAARNTSPNATNSIDRDEDGVPDIFDGVSDGTTIDSLDGDNKVQSKGASTAVQHIVFFQNLKIPIESSANFTVGNGTVITLEAIPADGTTISSIRAINVSSGFSEATIAPTSFQGTVPAPGTTWASENHQLYALTNNEQVSIFGVFLKMNTNDFAAGEMVNLLATMSDSSTEEFFATLNFRFSTIPVLTSSNAISGSGSNNDPFIIADDAPLTLTWTAPKDEDGNVIEGLNYTLEVFRLNAQGQQVSQTNVDVGVDTLTKTIPREDVDNGDPRQLKIDIKAQTPFGDNSALMLNVKRQSW